VSGDDDADDEDGDDADAVGDGDGPKRKKKRASENTSMGGIASKDDSGCEGPKLAQRRNNANKINKEHKTNLRHRTCSLIF
jgi:hypothetical protein